MHLFLICATFVAVTVIRCYYTKSNMRKWHYQQGREMKKEYSVLLPVYKGEKPEYFKKSIDCMLKQSIKPAELWILEDGELTDELENIVREYEEKFPETIKVNRHKTHRKLGLVLKEGVELASYEYISRMDSDDLCERERTERQFEVLEKHPDVDIVGTIYDEFLQEGVKGPVRMLPEKPDEILEFAHKRNPFGHSSILMKKQAVVDAGNYRDYEGLEDYDLWLRMFLNGSKGYNIQEALVHVRAGRDFYNRRGGKEYLARQEKFFKEFTQRGFFTEREYRYTIGVRRVFCRLPGWARSFLYKTLLRK